MNTVTFPFASRPIVLRAALAAVLFTVISAMPAVAGTPAQTDQTPQVVVRFADLNLASDEGALTLYRRIASAASRVCPDYGTRDLQRLQVIRACRDLAIANAVGTVGNERLAAIQAARSSRNRVG